MKNRIIRLINFPYVFRILGYLWYAVYVSQIIRLKEEHINYLPIFPNPILLGIIFMMSFLAISADQLIEPINKDIGSIIINTLLSSLPPLLGAKIIIQRGTIEKDRNNDSLFILGLYMVAGLLILISVSLIVLIILIIIYNPRFAVLYILVANILGYMGIISGDIFANITNRKKHQSSKWIEWLEILIGTKNRRVVLFSIEIVAVLILSLTNFYFEPVTLY